MLTPSQQIHAERNAASPILGRDKTWMVFKYSLAKLVTVDLMSQGFIWAVLACHLGYKVTMASCEKPIPENVLLGFGAHAFLACLYWSARGSFNNLLAAIADWLRGRNTPSAPPSSTDK